MPQLQLLQGETAGSTFLLCKEAWVFFTLTGYCAIYLDNLTFELLLLHIHYQMINGQPAFY